MKNIALFSLLLIIHISYAQSDNTTLNTSPKEFYESFGVFDEVDKNLKELASIGVTANSDNSEGKFPHYESNKLKFLSIYDNVEKDSYLTSYINNKSIVNEKILKNTSLAFINNEFIDDLIFKITYSYDKTSRTTMIVNSASNKVLCTTYKKQEDLLNVVVFQNKTVDVEIGNNIYKYINKLYKSEIDETLDFSLNLLAVNF